MKVKHGIVVCLIGVLIIGTVLTVSAQDEPPPSRDEAVAGPVLRGNWGGPRGFHMQGGRGVRRGLRGLGVPRGGPLALPGAIVEATGLTRGELMDALRSGQTAAEIITANGGNVDDVIDDALAAARARLNAAVESGRLTQDQADAMLSALETRMLDALNTSPVAQRIARQLSAGVLELIAEQTGLEPAAILAEHRAGSSLASIISANGGDLNAIIEEAVERADARLNVLVADDVMTSEKAAELLATLRQRLTERLTTAPEVDV